MTRRPNFTRDPIWETQTPKGHVVVGERKLNGSTFFDFRLWVGEEGSVPTGKGVTIPLDAVPGLTEALSLYAAQMDSGGAQGDS